MGAFVGELAERGVLAWLIEKKRLVSPAFTARRCKLPNIAVVHRVAQINMAANRSRRPRLFTSEMGALSFAFTRLRLAAGPRRVAKQGILFWFPYTRLRLTLILIASRESTSLDSWKSMPLLPPVGHTQCQ